ncbi:hypothetical protein C8J56DRAFT_934056 [Mycena floridula]|nr:hypothetical protein C8J56DRAFT_934056 [Mycena floridula]
MPKVISRGTVSSSTDAQPTASSTASLCVYYCICGEFCMVIDTLLASLPTRVTDQASIVRCQDSETSKARVFKLNAVSTDPILLEREGGHEKQYRFLCVRCNLPVAYSTQSDDPRRSPFLYIIKGSLCTLQGSIPKDAFDGEEPEISGAGEQ